MREEGKAEIINGRIQRFMASGDMPGRGAFNIALALATWNKIAKGGMIYPDGVGFLCDLAHRQSFSPDASYYTGVASGMKFLPTPPVFAVEVRSEGDYGAAMEREMEAKRADYFATETEVVWDIDLLGETVIVRKYTKTGGATTPVATFKRGDVADAEPAAPGFSMPVNDLFE
ncbi:MAG: Uma2 family endonuclease [Armatimonadetes bacterium]|nr:Uma2 family endonuclease [Armatimonadota bacterium]